MKIGIYGLILSALLFASMPSSSNYDLHNYTFGSGGTSGSSSSNYKLNATTGEVSNTQSASANYKVRSGNNNSQQANVPNAPSFGNPANYYDKLHFVVNPGGTSPTDTKYSIAISTDNFVTTNYVQADDTVGATKVYQTYASWGGSSGENAIGLTPSTTYYLKVNAIQGNFTETEYGPTASAATVAPNISFSINTDLQGSPPYSVAIGNLLPGTVITATNKIYTNIATNADSGAVIYISSQFAGLHSAHAGNTINSATADLSTASTGYGGQEVSVSQTTGGPLTKTSPYNGASNNVGAFFTSMKPLFQSTAPITGGIGSFQLMAKAAQSTPSATDYSDTLTLTAAGSF